MAKVVDKVDRFQRRHPVISLPLAVVYKFFEDQGNYLAAVVTYYAFIAIFPLMLLASSVLGFVLEGNPELQADLLESALGPAEGPGSGGRRRIAELEATIGVREHRVFYGAFDPTDPPRAMSERFVRMMPGSKGILPPGDFRDWENVDAWAREIAAALKPIPVGAAT